MIQMFYGEIYEYIIIYGELVMHLALHRLTRQLDDSVYSVEYIRFLKLILNIFSLVSG